MKTVRNLVLPMACLAVLGATAQQIVEHRSTRTIDIREDDKGATTVTIVTEENGTTNSITLTGEEAKAWLAEHRASEPMVMVEAPETEGDVVMPVFCRVIVQPDGAHGNAKAEVFRYRAKPRTTPTPVHTAVTNEEEVSGVEKGAMAQAASTDNDEMRVLPNPSEGLFTLAFKLPEEGGNGTLYITDAAGRVLHNEVVMGNGGQARTVDLRGREKGTYIATVAVGDRTISKRLVIE